jgi:hypothetical protein
MFIKVLNRKISASLLLQTVARMKLNLRAVWQMPEYEGVLIYL